MAGQYTLSHLRQLYGIRRADGAGLARDRPPRAAEVDELASGFAGQLPVRCRATGRRDGGDALRFGEGRQQLRLCPRAGFAQPTWTAWVATMHEHLATVVAPGRRPGPCDYLPSMPPAPARSGGREPLYRQRFSALRRWRGKARQDPPPRRLPSWPGAAHRRRVRRSSTSRASRPVRSPSGGPSTWRCATWRACCARSTTPYTRNCSPSSPTALGRRRRAVRTLRPGLGEARGRAVHGGLPGCRLSPSRRVSAALARTGQLACWTSSPR